MIQTYVAYGYRLGGPGTWALTAKAPTDRLDTPWFDETNPTHDFAARATDELAKGMISQRLTKRQRIAYDRETPIMFDTAIEVSPPGWTREAHGEPALDWQIPPSSPLRDLDRPTIDTYVLVANDSVRHLEAEEAALYDSDSDESLEIMDLRVDWDSLLDAALIELGIQMPILPDWFWYRTGFAD